MPNKTVYIDNFSVVALSLASELHQLKADKKEAEEHGYEPSIKHLYGLVDISKRIVANKEVASKVTYLKFGNLADVLYEGFKLTHGMLKPNADGVSLVHSVSVKGGLAEYYNSFRVAICDLAGVNDLTGMSILESSEAQQVKLLDRLNAEHKVYALASLQYELVEN